MIGRWINWLGIQESYVWKTQITNGELENLTHMNVVHVTPRSTFVNNIINIIIMTRTQPYKYCPLWAQMSHHGFKRQYLHGWVRVITNGIRVDPRLRCGDLFGLVRGVCLFDPQSHGTQRELCVCMGGCL